MNQSRKSVEQRYNLEEDAYLYERRLISENEEALFQHKSQSIHSLDELGERANVYLRDFFEDTSDLYQVFHLIEAAKEEVVSICQREQQKLDYKMEKINLDHQKNQSRYEEEIGVIRNEASC